MKANYDTVLGSEGLYVFYSTGELVVRHSLFEVQKSKGKGVKKTEKAPIQLCCWIRLLRFPREGPIHIFLPSSTLVGPPQPQFFLY